MVKAIIGPLVQNSETVPLIYFHLRPNIKSTNLTRLATALDTAWTGTSRLGIEFPSSPSSCRIISLLT